MNKNCLNFHLFLFYFCSLCCLIQFCYYVVLIKTCRRLRGREREEMKIQKKCWITNCKQNRLMIKVNFTLRMSMSYWFMFENWTALKIVVKYLYIARKCRIYSHKTDCNLLYNFLYFFSLISSLQTNLTNQPVDDNIAFLFRNVIWLTRGAKQLKSFLWLTRVCIVQTNRVCVSKEEISLNLYSLHLSRCYSFLCV